MSQSFVPERATSNCQWTGDSLVQLLPTSLAAKKVLRRKQSNVSSIVHTATVTSGLEQPTLLYPTPSLLVEVQPKVSQEINKSQNCRGCGEREDCFRT